MKVCCISDLHGHKPRVPECDLLLLAGDYAPAWRHSPVGFYRDQFQHWIREWRGGGMEVVGVAGNHDVLFEKRPLHVPSMAWTYLQDSGCELFGMKIWGSPWQPRFFDWAFNLDEPELAEKWNLIPDDTDILLLHGPPKGFGDWSDYGQEHCGSESLLDRIAEIQPRLVVSGHIHGGYGVRRLGETVIVNASYVNEQYRPAHPPVVIELTTAPPAQQESE